MNPEYIGPEHENEEPELNQAAPSALAILQQSEHTSMVMTANLPGNRRKLVDFESKLMAYANHSQGIALSMFYSLPRAGKQLIGPSVRFAEVVAPCWKNNAVAARVIGDQDNVVVGQGVFLDYELNVRNSVEVPRRITDKDNRRFSADMVVTTANAAMSVARRNAVLKGGVPQALWTPAYDAAQLTAVGKAASHAQRVSDAMEYLLKLGVTEWQILNAVGVPSPRELETEHLVILRVLCQEIKKGDKTIEQVFGSPYDKEIDSLFAQMKMNGAQQTMLRNSYLGRAQELVTYLRDRVGSATKGATSEAPQRPQAAEPRVDQPVDQPDKTAGTQSTEDWAAQKSTTPAWNAKHLGDKPTGKRGEFPFGTNQAPPDDAAQNRTTPDTPPAQPVAETRNSSDGTTATGVAPLPGQPPAQGERPISDTPSGLAADTAPWGGMTDSQPTMATAPTQNPAPEPLPPGLAREPNYARPATHSGGSPQTTMEPQRRRGRPSREDVARREAAEQGMFPPSEQEARREAEKATEVSDKFAF